MAESFATVASTDLIPPTADDGVAAAVVLRELAAFSRHDLDAAIAAFAPEATIVTGHRGPPIAGSDGIRFYVTDLYARHLGIRLEAHSCVCTRHGAAEATCHARWRAWWHDRDSGQTVGRDGGAAFRVADGLIVEVRLRAHPERMEGEPA